MSQWTGYNEYNKKDLNQCFTMEELERAIRNVKEKSSTDMDQIEYKMIKGLSEIFAGTAKLTLLNWSFKTGYKGPRGISMLKLLPHVSSVYTYTWKFFREIGKII